MELSPLMYCLKRRGIISPYVLFKKERNYLSLCTVLKGKELPSLERRKYVAV
jgi:hypothetical protein